MGRARIPADIRSGAVEAGDLVFLYRNLAVPESSGKMEEQKPGSPEPETDEDNKGVAPPVAPDGGRMADGLMPLPGEQPVPASADQERISREREKILRELESVPDRLEEPWSRRIGFIRNTGTGHPSVSKKLVFEFPIPGLIF